MNSKPNISPETDLAAVHVRDLSLDDVVSDLRILLDDGDESLDAITANVVTHPQWDPASGQPEPAMLVRFTDSVGRVRVAEVRLDVSWLTTHCGHTETRPAVGGGRECVTCGAPDSADLHCPKCRGVVADHATYFAEHTHVCRFRFNPLVAGRGPFGESMT